MQTSTAHNFDSKEQKLSRKHSYGRLNPNVDLKSECFAELPSLELTESIWQVDQCSPFDDNYNEDYTNYIAGDAEAIENGQKSHEQSSTGRTDRILSEVASEEYLFPKIAVTIRSVSESLYEDNFRFRKLSPNCIYEGSTNLVFSSRCPQAVAFKILSTNPSQTRAVPNRGIIFPSNDVGVTIYLKSWDEEYIKYLRFQIRLARLDVGFNLFNVWSKESAVISYSPLFRCVLIDDIPSDWSEPAFAFEDEEMERQEEEDEEQEVADTKPSVSSVKTVKVKFAPRPTFVPKNFKRKHSRFNGVRKFLRRMSKFLRRVRGKPKKLSCMNSAEQSNSNIAVY